MTFQKQIQKINFANIAKQITTPWKPAEAARLNNQILRVAFFKGQYHWHSHTLEDELFFVLDGEITLQLRGQSDVVVKTGEAVVVPHGVGHCPKSEAGARVILFEPQSLSVAGNKT